MSNKLPLKVRVKAYYEDFMYNGFSQQTQYLPPYSSIDDQLEYYLLDEAPEEVEE